MSIGGLFGIGLMDWVKLGQKCGLCNIFLVVLKGEYRFRRGQRYTAWDPTKTGANILLWMRGACTVWKNKRQTIRGPMQELDAAYEKTASSFL